MKMGNGQGRDCYISKPIITLNNKRERVFVYVLSVVLWSVPLPCGWLGASPNFLVSDISAMTKLGVGDVKCPYFKRDMTIKKACHFLCL